MSNNVNDIVITTVIVSAVVAAVVAAVAAAAVAAVVAAVVDPRKKTNGIGITTIIEILSYI